MRLNPTTLPQLAVLAKILCLLMVVMCGAVPAKVRSVSLYSTCSSGNVTVMGRLINALGRDEFNAPYQQLTTQSEDFSRKLYIFAEVSQRYICFNKRWKLVGLTKEERGPMCQFYEVYSGSYLRYRSAADVTRYLGFNKIGKPIRGAHGRAECHNFLKFNPSADIEIHNRRVKTNLASLSYKRSSLSTTTNKNSLINGVERMEHRHNHQLKHQKLRRQQLHNKKHKLTHRHRHSNRWRIRQEEKDHVTLTSSSPSLVSSSSWSSRRRHHDSPRLYIETNNNNNDNDNDNNKY